MKRKKVSKRLVLKKETIVNINHSQLDAARGGAVSNDINDPICPTLRCQTPDTVYTWCPCGIPTITTCIY